MAIILFKRFPEPDQYGNLSPTFREYSKALHWIFHCLRDIAENPDVDTPESIVITSINDSEHKINSKHYTDKAVDVRSKNFHTLEAKIRFQRRLEAILNSHPLNPSSFSVILENLGTSNEHFHIQVKKGHSF